MKTKIIYLCLILFFVVGTVSVVFYWFQYRPSKIRHDCSWVERHSDVIPYRPAMTEAELKTKGLVKDCAKEGNSFFYQYIKSSNDPTPCESNNQRVIYQYSRAQEAVPAKSWWVEAIPSEYSFCLHDKGL